MMIWKSDDTLLKGLPAGMTGIPKTYSSNIITLLRPNQFIINMECCFEHYHFAVPTVTPPPVRIGNKLYTYRSNRILALNPENPILNTQYAQAKEYTALFVNRKFLQEVSYTMTGRADVQFKYDNPVLSKRLKDTFDNFMYEFTSMEFPSPLMLDSLSNQIAALLLREVNSNISGLLMEKAAVDKPHAKIAVEFIEEYYNSNISLEDLSKVTNLSPYHLIRVFKEETGKTPHEYLLDKKIQIALELIRNNELSMNEISQICGFVNQGHFSTTFKKIVGVNPLTYKKSVC